MSTRAACHSEFFAWLFLLWPRLNQNSNWVNLKRRAFWENQQFVVTSPFPQKFQGGLNILVQFWVIVTRTDWLAIPVFAVWEDICIVTNQYLVTFFGSGHAYGPKHITKDWLVTNRWNSFVDISEVNRQVIYRNRSAGQNISQYIECTRQDKIYIAIYRMHSGGSDQTMNILVYIPTHHSELEKKEKAVG